MAKDDILELEGEDFDRNELRDIINSASKRIPGPRKRTGRPPILRSGPGRKTSKNAARHFPVLLYTPEEAALILGLSTHLVLMKWMKRGYPHLPYVKVGEFIRYLEPDLIRFLENNRVIPQGENFQEE